MSNLIRYKDRKSNNFGFATIAAMEYDVVKKKIHAYDHKGKEYILEKTMDSIEAEACLMNFVSSYDAWFKEYVFSCQALSGLDFEREATFV